MAKLYNLARVATATTGTGTITLGAAVSGYLTFALAGVSDAEVVSYGIKDGANSEVGTGTYTASGTTLTRSVTKSTNSDNAISLSGSAEVYTTARKEDFLNAADPLTSAQFAAQSDQETATSTTLAVAPGTQHFHPGHIKAAYSATVTPTAITGAATSWDTTAETCLWNTTHGLTTGNTFIPVTNAPGGTTNLSPYYVNVVSTTVFSLHTTYADAVAGTNKVNITSSTLTTGRKLVYTDEVSYNMASGSPVSGVAATAAMGLVFNLGVTLSAAKAITHLSGKNFEMAGSPTASFKIVGYPSSFGTTSVTYANTSLMGFDADELAALDTWSGQSTTAFSVSFILLGDI